MDVSVRAREIAALIEAGEDAEALVAELLHLREVADAGPAELRGLRRCAIAEALGRVAGRSEAARAALRADAGDADGFGDRAGGWWVGVADIARRALDLFDRPPPRA